MTPSEHYYAAETILKNLNTYGQDALKDALAKAQVHATLATVPASVQADAQVHTLNGLQGIRRPQI